MIIPVKKFIYFIGLYLALITFTVPLHALDAEQADWTQTKEKWGRIIFCQRIYKMPEVQPRLYSFDAEQCNGAARLILDGVARYSALQRAQLNRQAEQHAVALSYNTAEPYHSVAACREYCRELVETQEQHNDQ